MTSEVVIGQVFLWPAGGVVTLIFLIESLRLLNQFRQTERIGLCRGVAALTLYVIRSNDRTHKSLYSYYLPRSFIVTLLANISELCPTIATAI